MIKKILKTIKIHLPGGQATSTGPLSSKLAFLKINTGAFIKEYNERTKDNIGYTIPAVITVYDDKSFTFQLKTTPTAELLKKMCNLNEGSKTGNKDFVGELHYNDLKSIAIQKLNDLNTKNLEKATKCVEGTALNMGIKILRD